MSAASKAVGDMLRASIAETEPTGPYISRHERDEPRSAPMSRAEAALYGTPAARAHDRAQRDAATPPNAAQRATLAEHDAIEALLAMKRDFERAYDEAMTRIATGIMACDRAIAAINESRTARGLPVLPGRE